MLGHRLRGVRHVGRQHRLRRDTGEGRPAAEHLVGQHPHRVDVRPMVGMRVRRGLLRRHVQRRPQRHTHRGQRLLPGRFGHRLRHAKVRHQRVAFGEHDVVRFDIPVHDMVPMRVGQRIQHVAQDAQRLGHRQLALARQFGPERFALDVGHDVVEEIVRGSRGQQRHDVGVLEVGRQLNLALEPVHAHAGAHLGWQDLHHHAPAEGGVLRDEDAAHPSAAQLALDPVAFAERRLEALPQLGHRGQDTPRRWTARARR